jgi:hypothetical protein
VAVWGADTVPDWEPALWASVIGASPGRQGPVASQSRTVDTRSGPRSFHSTSEGSCAPLLGTRGPTGGAEPSLKRTRLSTHPEAERTPGTRPLGTKRAGPAEQRNLTGHASALAASGSRQQFRGGRSGRGSPDLHRPARLCLGGRAVTRQPSRVRVDTSEGEVVMRRSWGRSLRSWRDRIRPGHGRPDPPTSSAALAPALRRVGAGPSSAGLFGRLRHPLWSQGRSTSPSAQC